MYRCKSQLRIDDEVGAGTCGFFERSQPPLHVTREVGRWLLLDQGDFHFGVRNYVPSAALRAGSWGVVMFSLPYWIVSGGCARGLYWRQSQSLC